jgi:hypothetical protein
MLDILKLLFLFVFLLILVEFQNSSKYSVTNMRDM